MPLPHKQKQRNFKKEKENTEIPPTHPQPLPFVLKRKTQLQILTRFVTKKLITLQTKIQRSPARPSGSRLGSNSIKPLDIPQTQQILSATRWRTWTLGFKSWLYHSLAVQLCASNKILFYLHFLLIEKRKKICPKGFMWELNDNPYKIVSRWLHIINFQQVLGTLVSAHMRFPLPELVPQHLTTTPSSLPVCLVIYRIPPPRSLSGLMLPNSLCG